MKIDLRELSLLKRCKEGDEVITSKGFTFARRGEGWLDVTSGVVWHYPEEGTFNHQQAVEKLGADLPSKELFEEAEEHGFREVLEINTARFIWSSSVHPDHPVNAYVLYGGNGYIDYINRGFGHIVTLRGVKVS